MDTTSAEWKQCSVIDISREGMGITIYSRERISIGARLRMEIMLPFRSAPVPMEGMLMWLRELQEHPQFNYIGGIRIIDIQAADKWMLIDYAYEGWQSGVTQDPKIP